MQDTSVRFSNTKAMGAIGTWNDIQGVIVLLNMQDLQSEVVMCEELVTTWLLEVVA